MTRNSAVFMSAILAVAFVVSVGGQCVYGELVWDGSKWVEPKIPEPGTPEGDLVLIRKKVEMGAGHDAVAAVETFLIDHGESPACEEALNLGGQALINAGDYWDSYKIYEKQINEYPNGMYYYRALDREYFVADAFLNGRKRKFWKIFRLSAKEDGVEMLIQIAARSPVLEVGQRALLRIGDYHFDEKQYQDAVDFYDRFMEGYPDSPKRPYAMYRAAEACLMAFRGLDHDKTPLIRAKLRFRTFAAAYPEQARQRNVGKTLMEIDETMAEKLFEIGNFYERVQRPEAATAYYERILTEYGHTEYAEFSRIRIEELGPIERTVEPPADIGEGELVKPPSDPPGENLLIPVEEIDGPVGEYPKPTDGEEDDSKERLKPLGIEDILKLRERGQQDDN